LHYLLPFVILFLTLVHIGVLHESGSNNPLNIIPDMDTKIQFHPYFIIKDILGFILFIFILLTTVFYLPDSVIHSDNFIPANPLVTPTHIVPEWYFLPFYAILRSIPNKLGGVFMLFLALLVLFILPFIVNNIYKATFFEIWKNKFFWFFLIVCLLLG
jgi:quinol-cytochrome oxidoreductase complex cytochrome b subunit